MGRSNRQASQRVNGRVGPRRVQIQTQAGCNGRCVFCPNEDVLQSGLPHGKMDPALFRKIIDDLSACPPERIMLYLMNEPLNDKRMPEFVEYVSQRIPSATTLITSNGTKLRADLMEGLLDAGLKRLKISLQSLDDETNKAIMGYPATPVVDNVLAAQEVVRRKNAKFDLRVSMVVTKQTEPQIEEARRFWKRHGVRLVTSALENRGGNIGEAAGMNTGEMRARHDCIRPFREMCILWNGDVVLCCVDWRRTVIAGNVADTPAPDVWNASKFQEIRRAFEEQDIGALPEICVNCTESACPEKHRRGISGVLSRLLGR